MSKAETNGTPFQEVYNALHAAEQAIAKVRVDEWAAIGGTGIRGEAQDVLSATTRLRDILKRNGLAE